MDYSQLAPDLFSNLVKFSNCPFQKESRDFNLGEMGILCCLYFDSDEITAGELSEKLDISTGRVATALNSLERKNMIIRSHDNSDKRRVIVHITSFGINAVLEKQQHGIKCVEKMLQKLGEDDAREFARIMQRIITL